MRAQSDATEADEQDDQYCAGDRERAPAPRFDRGDYKKCELPVKQSRSDGVTACKTVAGPVHELTGNEWTRPMDEHLDQLVQQHAARYSHDKCRARRPPSFPGKKQHPKKQDDADPLT